MESVIGTMDVDDEERYWQGLLGALVEGPPNVINVSSEHVRVADEYVMGSCSMSLPLKTTSQPLQNDGNGSNETEAVSLFEDVDLEDEKQFYFNYYKEYFESAAQHDGPPEPNKVQLSQPSNHTNGNEFKVSSGMVVMWVSLILITDCLISPCIDVDVWSENLTSQQDYDFMFECVSETKRSCDAVEGSESTNGWKIFGTNLHQKMNNRVECFSIYFYSFNPWTTT